MIRAAPKHLVQSICDASGAYGFHLLDNAASALAPDCVPEPIPADHDCFVQDLTQNSDGTITMTDIPQCPNDGPNPGTDPCWRIEPSAACSTGLRLTVDRAGAPAPPATQVAVACSC